MIAFVRGSVAALSVDAAVVDVAGVGIKVLCSPATLAGLRVGTAATLATSMVVREDSLTLFGFADDDERSLFELVQTASGVGPKLAQAMLAVHGPDDLRRAVAGNDLVALCRVPGVGRKGAQRIVLELKDRIGPVPSTPAAGDRRGVVADDGWRDTVRSALLGLGWTARESDAALEAVAPAADAAVTDGHPLSTPDLLRAALRSLSRS
ncbi:MAG: Holliday junction branch migration protein RuvA [Nocardioidaceae bacterium]